MAKKPDEKKPAEKKAPRADPKPPEAKPSKPVLKTSAGVVIDIDVFPLPQLAAAGRALDKAFPGKWVEVEGGPGNVGRVVAYGAMQCVCVGKGGATLKLGREDLGMLKSVL